MISVIVPVYNGEQYIENCLQSILKQTYTDIEIVIIDDGSNDGSANILDDYASKYHNIKVKHIPNGGVMNARTLGIRMASGDWIGFVDGDDEIEADMYERLLKNAEQYHADISHCGYKTVQDGVVKHEFYNSGRVREQDRIQGLKDLIEGREVEPGLWNKLFKRTLFEGIFDKEIMNRRFKFNEDLLLNYLLFANADKSIYEDFCPYHYLIHEHTATRSKKNLYKVFDPIEIRKWILADVPMEVYPIAKKRYLDTCIAAYTSLLCFPEEKEGRKQVREELMKYKTYWKNLSRNARIKVVMSCYAPHLYLGIYSFYVRKFQKKVYE